MKASTAAAIGVSVISVGVYLGNAWIIFGPFVWIGLTGLVQEVVAAYARNEEAEHVEEIPEQAGLSIVAGELQTIADASLQWVVDPLSKANEEHAQAEEGSNFIAGDFDVDREADG